MKNKFTLKGKYNLRSILPMLGIAGASMFAVSCNEDEPDLPKHDTVYQFNQVNFVHVDLGQILRSADSIQVRNIIFRVSPKSDWESINMKGVSNMLKSVFGAAKGKGVADGTFRNVTEGTNNIQYADSVRAYGYQVEFKQKQR